MAPGSKVCVCSYCLLHYPSDRLHGALPTAFPNVATLVCSGLTHTAAEIKICLWDKKKQTPPHLFSLGDSAKKLQGRDDGGTKIDRKSETRLQGKR